MHTRVKSDSVLSNIVHKPDACVCKNDCVVEKHIVHSAPKNKKCHSNTLLSKLSKQCDYVESDDRSTVVKNRQDIGFQKRSSVPPKLGGIFVNSCTVHACLYWS